jgi:hypothetical protein
MRPLVALRHAAPYDPAFLDRSPLLEPVRAAAGRLPASDDFPSPEVLAAVFAGESPVRFVSAEPRARRRVRPRAVESMYDARITLERCVPTRPRCWHDLMNALVWGTFPLAKAALHARQHRAIAERVPRGSTRLPPTRTRELDALALLDEGGVVVLARDADRMPPERLAVEGSLRDAILAREVEVTVVGHAIFESLVLGVAPAVVAAVVLVAEGGDGDRVRRADVALAEGLGDPLRFRSPTELRRVDLREVAGAI